MDERRRQSLTVSAKTVDDAVAEAERELGVPREQLDITVITEGSKGFLGMRAENARILAVVMSGAVAQAADAPPPSVQDVEVTTGALASTVERDGDESAAGVDAVDAGHDLAEELSDDQDVEPGKRAQQRHETARLAQEILETLLRQMDIEAQVSVRSTADPIVLDVATEHGGLLIGRRGDTLGALQYLVNVLVGKRTRGWTKVVIDIEGWRERREDALRALAQRQADRARREQRPVPLDPMPASERRIVHMTLQGSHDIETHSEGEEPNRRLIITPKR